MAKCGVKNYKGSNQETIFSNSIDMNRSLWLKEEYLINSGACDKCSRKNLSAENCVNCEKLYNAALQNFEDTAPILLEEYDEVLENSIVVFADLGLWNGRKRGFKVLGRNLKSLFYWDGEFTVYKDSYNVRGICHHHDGTNYMLFRMLKSQYDIDWFKDYVARYDYELTSQQLSQYTESLKKWF